MGIQVLHPDNFLLDQLDLAPRIVPESFGSKRPAPTDQRSRRLTSSPDSHEQVFQCSPTKPGASCDAYAAPFRAPEGGAPQRKAGLEFSPSGVVVTPSPAFLGHAGPGAPGEPDAR